MKLDEVVYLKHIIEAIERIEQFTNKISKSEFDENVLVQDGVIRRLEIIGEATKNISSDFKAKYPDIEWKKAAGLRDVLIHSYFGVDLDLVWDIAKRELPDLKKKIARVLAKVQKAK